jgi:outer membrane protein OmpA-like peptidoglycan-associated protein
MRITINTFRTATLFLVATAALSGCGNVSHRVAKDGQSAESLVWPVATDTAPMHKGGTFPNRANVMQLQAGLSKPQIANLVGYPHFNEGVWGVREWNYLFNFREPENSANVVTCQFKILFDNDKIARSFYWLPESCVRFQKPEQAPAVAAPPVSTERFTFAADALFAFDRSSITDITGSGHAQLDEVVQGIQQHGKDIQSIRVLGFTDRLGSDAYNNTLSQKRADSVRNYLMSHGVDGDLITADGRGKSDPVKECSDTDRAGLVNCLAPNRRVEILVNSARRAAASH